MPKGCRETYIGSRCNNIPGEECPFLTNDDFKLQTLAAQIKEIDITTLKYRAASFAPNSYKSRKCKYGQQIYDVFMNEIKLRG